MFDYSRLRNRSFNYPDYSVVAYVESIKHY